MQENDKDLLLLLRKSKLRGDEKLSLGLGARFRGFCPVRGPNPTPSPKRPRNGILARRPGAYGESDKGEACENRGSLPLEEKVSQIEDFFMDRITCRCC